MYRKIPATDARLQEVVIETPLDDYALIDFGNGRKLERFGPWVVDRPDRLPCCRYRAARLLSTPI